jgi:polar amino acid transport system substrate-binding protein
LVLAVVLFAAKGALADTIALRADPWCPYTCSPDSDQPGFAVEIARAAFEASGHVVDYQELNWARSVEETRRGLHAGIIGAIVADAPDFIFASEPIAVGAIGFAVRKGTAFRFEGAGSLTGKVLGTISGYAFAGEVGTYIEAHGNDRAKVQLTSGEEALAKNFKKLLDDRIDVLVDDVNVLRHAINELGLGDAVEIADTDATGAVYIAFSPAIPRAEEYARGLSDGIVRLRASGRLAEILKPYGIADWR